MKFVFVAATLLFLAPLICRAEGPDEQYVRIYQLIQEADRLNDSGQSSAAAVKYVEAQEGLTRFRGIYPGWNERVINYRLNYVTTKLAPISSALAARVTSVAPPSTNVLSSATNMTAVPSTTNVIVPMPATPVPSIASTEIENQLKASQAEVARLQGDNRLLNAKLKEALSVQPAAADPRELAKAEDRIRALQKENELYKVRLSPRANEAVASVAPPELTARLKEQTDAVAALRSENEILKKHNAEWQKKYDAVVAAANVPKTSPAVAASPGHEAAVRDLAAQNLALQKQVELWKQVAQSTQRSQPPAVSADMPADVQRELSALRARLQVLEAKPVPYTAEELALFERSPASLVANASTLPLQPGGTAPPAEGPLGNATRGIPPGAGALVRAAERSFTVGNFAEAEQKYSEVVRQDQNNVTMLGNLASAQLELGRAAEAEKNVTRALQMDPNDYFALYLLGRIRFGQEKLDEAFVALSRSVQTNPDYADAQNYLGIVLSEKGQRGPAEAALRRAVQIRPDHAVAHNNLALVYATQKPPALALARWHYRKAMAAGHAKNAELEKLIGPLQ